MDTFTDFKKQFFLRVPDLTLFNCGNFNLLKVVLDGLKVDYISKGKVNPFLFYPEFAYSSYLMIKRKKSNKSQTNAFFDKIKTFKYVEYLISDVGRSVNDGQGTFKSIYFDNIIKSIGQEKLVNIVDKEVNFSYDFNVLDIEQFFMHLPLTHEEFKLRLEVIKTFKRIADSSIFTDYELKNIKFAFHKFFHQYKVWARLLKELPSLTKCYFVCHYHKEGQILALKNAGIECVELQHGLIAPQDIFYIFPDNINTVRKNALFADKIYLFGEYWKNVLLKGREYDSNQIEIIGYYLYDDFTKYAREREILNEIILDKKVVLITTQTFIHKGYIEFTMALLKEIELMKEPYIIIIKPHPAENQEIYRDAFVDSKTVKVLQYPLTVLLEKADLHISIYSTTLYDALRYNIKNYVFKVKGCEDYVNEIVESGVAEEIMSPKDIFNNSKKQMQLQSELFYEKFNKASLN